MQPQNDFYFSVEDVLFFSLLIWTPISSILCKVTAITKVQNTNPLEK